MGKTLIQTRKFYLHGCKDSNWDMIDEIQEETGHVFSDEAKENLPYTAYEVEFTINVYSDGTVKVLKIGSEDVSDKNVSL